jgi:hypothetical protein
MVLNIAIYLIHLGIYKSATLVSANNIVRKSIHKHALESRQSDLFGYEEMGREIQKNCNNNNNNLESGYFGNGDTNKN